MQFKKGFSLLELLITISILSIVAALAVPSLQSFYVKTRQKIASRQILRAIALAKSSALLNDKTVTLCKSADHVSCSGSWEQGQILFLDEKRNGQVADKTKILAYFDPMPNGILYWRSSLSRDYLQFEPANKINIEDGTFWYCSKGALRPGWAIRINPWGRARLELPDKRGKIATLAC